IIEPPLPLPDIGQANLRRAAIIVEGSATPQAIAGYLSNVDIKADIVEPANAVNVSDGRYDVLFVDAVTAQNTQQSFNPVPVILVSELGDASSEGLLTSGRADDQIMRPIRRRDMFDAIERLANGTLRGAGALSASTSEIAKLPDFAGTRVLVADDNAINREVIIEALRRLNVTVDTADDGQDAVGRWESGDYALVFMDCSMPVMDGYEATRLIRQRETELAKARVPVIALTAHVAGGPADQWRTVGMDDMITKPFTLETIANRLTTWLPKSCITAHLDIQSDESIGAAAVEQELQPVVDRQVIENLQLMSGGNNDLLSKTSELFRQHGPQALAKVELAAESADLKALADAAHALKSMCANMGAVRSAAACNELEELARTGASFDIGGHITRISRELAEAIAEVDSMCAA
ncbi:MAG: response regulator, partial [Aestuariivirgaceae bacterium]